MAITQQAPDTAVEPRAQKKSAEIHPESCATTPDPYQWLRDDDRQDKEVLAYVAAENKYAKQYFASVKDTVDDLMKEMDARLPAVEVQGLHRSGGYVYYDKRSPGDQYWNAYRTKAPRGADRNELNISSITKHQGGPDSTPNPQQQQQQGPAQHQAEELVLDQNKLATGHSYFDVVTHEVDPGGEGALVAYLVDVVGNEDYILQVVAVASGRQLLERPIPGCTGDLTWSEDGTAVVFTAKGGRILALRVDQLLLSNNSTSSSSSSNAPKPTCKSNDTAPLGPAHTGSSSRDDSSAAAAPSACAVTLVELYETDEDESGVSISRSRDGQYFILMSYIEGDQQVQVLPMEQLRTLTKFDPTSSASSKQSYSPGVTLVKQQQPWQVLLSWREEMGVLAADHWRDGTFILIADSDEAPDGQLLAVALADQQQQQQQQEEEEEEEDGKQGEEEGEGEAERGQGRARMVVLLDSFMGDEPVPPPDTPTSPTQPPPVNRSSTTPAVPEAAGAFEGPPLLEVNDFAVGDTHLAVALRVNCRSTVWVFDLVKHGVDRAVQAAAASAGGAEGHIQEGVADTRGRWGASASGSSSSSTSGVSQCKSALLCEPDWEIPPEDPTMILSLKSITEVGPHTPHPLLVLKETSIVTPVTTVECDLVTHQMVVTHVEQVLGGFNREHYESSLEWVGSKGGVQVPVTLAWRKDLLNMSNSNPALLMGYGAYGAKKWPSFNPEELSLLDRGWVLAVAHIRGGSELGARWHTEARKMKKKNTFYDFLAVAQHLVARGYTRPQLLALWGRSAGGLTVGATLNMNPTCCGAAILDVPFLDVLADMLDPSLLLTIKERGDWGDPLHDEEACKYIASYSPYDNVLAGAAYPSMLLTASLHDHRVNYWEPLKYVAKLREVRGNKDSKLLLLTDEEAGHFAASGAKKRLQQQAEKFAFLLETIGSMSA